MPCVISLHQTTVHIHNTLHNPPATAVLLLLLLLLV